MGDSEQESGNGNWLVTYSDLVTLLLVFFVLLYVLTPGIDQSTFNNFISHFQSSVSVVNENNASRKQPSNNTLREEWEQIKKYLEEQGLSSEVKIQRIKDGVKITLSDSLTFNSGSARLLARAKDVIEKISGVMGRDVREVKTQGHTDDVPIASNSMYRSNWHLGAARAVSVVQFMSREAPLSPHKFEASSFGEYKPVTTNDTKEGRRKNRRVEIYVRYYENVSPKTASTVKK
ncbi:OmpA/MotB family protein [Fodinibius saliphilus]|uniref:OmpA/MotB family protein n=1 Tax=Fodinibius saliphilus TaxID=1920650 RepID=UPI001108529D|nr:OmpA family protein [Fodinibius saliphilus]